MLMKVSNKGQVVIPVSIRNQLRLDVGDLLDVSLDEATNTIFLTKHAELRSQSLAGSLAQYAKGKRFSSRRRLNDALREGLLGGKTSD